MIDKIFSISKDIRYVAIYKNGILKSKSKDSLDSASSSESDKYEELFINPVILTAATQRGNVDCGGLDYLLIKYSNFFQFVKAIEDGHISICIDKNADAIEIGKKIEKLYSIKFS